MKSAFDNGPRSRAGWVAVHRSGACFGVGPATVFCSSTALADKLADMTAEVLPSVEKTVAECSEFGEQPTVSSARAAIRSAWDNAPDGASFIARLCDAGFVLAWGEARQRHMRLRIRLSAAEQAQIEEKAERAGLTPASYARAVLLNTSNPVRSVRRPPIERLALAQLLGQLGRLNSNVNQIAKALNSNQAISRAEMRQAAGELAALRDAIRAALGRGPDK